MELVSVIYRVLWRFYELKHVKYLQQCPENRSSVNVCHPFNYFHHGLQSGGILATTQFSEPYHSHTWKHIYGHVSRKEGKLPNLWPFKIWPHSTSSFEYSLTSCNMKVLIDMSFFKQNAPFYFLSMNFFLVFLVVVFCLFHFVFTLQMPKTNLCLSTVNGTLKFQSIFP